MCGLATVGPLAQLRNLHVHPSGACLPGSGSIPVPIVHPVGAALVCAGAAELVNIQRHEAVGEKLKHFGKQVSVGRFRQKRTQRHGL